MLAVVTLLGEHGDMYRLKLHYSQCTQYCMHELYRPVYNHEYHKASAYYSQGSGCTVPHPKGQLKTASSRSVKFIS